MKNNPQLQPRTRAFARVLGPFCGIVGATTAARASEMRRLLTDFEASPVWAWVTGSFVLLIGIAIVALHPYWRGAAAATVSVLGWIFALRGLLLLAFPGAFMSVANATIGMGPLWVSVCILLTMAGMYLTYVGWRPAAPQQAGKAVASDLPRAA